MEVIGLLLLSFAGSVVWLFNTEATAIVYGSQKGWHPLFVGVICALGQLGMHVALYLGGARLAVRWRWLREREERVRRRWGERLEQRYLIVTAVGAFLGAPPVVVMAALAPGFGVPLRHLVPIVFPLRVARFTLLAALGTQIGPWLKSLWS